MMQLTQQLKSGKMEILEVPFPALNRGQILVRNHYSVISAGTEGKTVTDARKGYIAKAKSRQKEVKQVIEMIKTNGLLPTYKLVMNKLEAPSPLGYSCAGEVIAVGEGVSKFKIGDKVACGGQGAFHADVVSVYENLCVKIPENVDIKHAAFSTIASIAIQGIRQADLRFGENCVVIGLGLVGQLTMQILKATGIKAIGIDINDEQVRAVKNAGANYAYNRNQAGIEDIIKNYTNGYGCDAVIIAAATSSLDPVEFAGTIARKKGKVVIVGAVPTGFSRSNYYKKELELRMSSSYGPGRYDANYEEKGIDYPIGYVRFTENRNMQSFVDLLADNKLNLDKIITHQFLLFDAPKAYNLILEKKEHFAGILIKYDEKEELQKRIVINDSKPVSQEPNVGFIGAGSFAQNTLLPNLKGLCNFIGLATGSGNNSKYVGKKYAFNYCTNEPDEILSDKNINTVFVATRHNLHAQYVIKALENGKNVFVEKPLCMNEDELEKIREVYTNPRLLNSDTRHQKSDIRHPTSDFQPHTHFMVGFNRRFSPYIQKIKNIFSDEQPKAINIRINAGQLPAEHWVNDPDIGGGRIIGEACHFIDLAMFLAGAKTMSLSAESMIDPNNLNNTISINLTFINGSIANISYFSNGSKQLPKEHIEVFCGGTVIAIDDFNKMVKYSNKIKKIRFSKQDKGHKEELKQFIDSIKDGKPAPVSFEDCYHSTYVTLKTIESIKTKRRIDL